MNKRAYDPASTDRISLYKMLAGVVVPRPIGLISTKGSDGRRNVAPFSFFNLLSDKPPYVAVSISAFNAEGRRKDTLQNILDTREFVVNIVSQEIVEAQDICAREFPRETDEFSRSGLTAANSTMIGAPAVEQSKVNLECKLHQVMPLEGSTYTLLVGCVVFIRMQEGLLAENGRVDMDKLAAVGRMVGNAYCTTAQRFTLERDTFAKPFAGIDGKT
jgi:flavin reductase (DIM6/NTAB) family NADH-FMN oxidoreductase RutF